MIDYACGCVSLAYITVSSKKPGVLSILLGFCQEGYAGIIEVTPATSSIETWAFPNKGHAPFPSWNV